MHHSRFRHADGFTLLELLVVVALVIVLFATAVINLLPLRGAAERVQYLQITGQLQSAFGLRTAELAMANNGASLADIVNENPMGWLHIVPENYRGEVKHFDDLAPGQWGWLAAQQVLAYRLRYPEYVKTGAFRQEWLRLVVYHEYTDEGMLRQLALQSLDHPVWFENVTTQGEKSR